jgi:uncharacterized protein YxjI
MSENRHWTPKSGFFPCVAREGNCPKPNQHYATGSTAVEVKNNYRVAEQEAGDALIQGNISPQQFNKVVGQLRKETTTQLKTLKRAEKLAAKPQSRTRISTKLTQGASAFVGGAVLVGTLTGCGATVAELPDATNNVKDSESIIQTLDEAEEINLKKAAISMGDSWDVKVNDENIANMKGQVIPVLGDTYTMYSTDGNVVGSEAQQVAQIMRGATLYDYNNVERGEIEQNLNLLFSKYTITDNQGNTVGTAEQKLSITLNFDIKNAEGEVEYTVSKAAFSWGASLDIERQVDNPDVSAQDAVWLTVIANEVAEAQSNSKK